MDVVVNRLEQTDVWELTDLLGRLMGTVTRQENGGFTIAPLGKATATMQLVRRGPHPSLDAALQEIETRTRGVCRRRDHAAGGA